MNMLKVTSSGQITIPKHLREKMKTSFFICEEKDGMILFKPVVMKREESAKKYTLKDLEKAIFTGKDSKEKNLAGKIDEIVYGL